jgi:hypothetical protein
MGLARYCDLLKTVSILPQVAHLKMRRSRPGLSGTMNATNIGVPHPEHDGGFTSSVAAMRLAYASSTLRSSGVAQAPPKNSPRVEQTGPGPRAQRRASCVWLNYLR